LRDLIAGLMPDEAGHADFDAKPLVRPSLCSKIRRGRSFVPPKGVSWRPLASTQTNTSCNAKGGLRGRLRIRPGTARCASHRPSCRRERARRGLPHLR
jgi:hypothetical protein